jgi:hypothetical protein
VKEFQALGVRTLRDLGPALAALPPEHGVAAVNVGERWVRLGQRQPVQPSAHQGGGEAEGGGLPVEPVLEGWRRLISQLASTYPGGRQIM